MLKLVESIGRVEFATCWSLYPKKEGKRYAQKCWDRLTEVEKQLVEAALPNHVAKWRGEERSNNFIPDFSTWLNRARWEDEVVIPVKAKDRPLSLSQQPATLPNDSTERTPMPDDVRDKLRKFNAKFGTKVKL